MAGNRTKKRSRSRTVRRDFRKRKGLRSTRTKRESRKRYTGRRRRGGVALGSMGRTAEDRATAAAQASKAANAAKETITEAEKLKTQANEQKKEMEKVAAEAKQRANARPGAEKAFEEKKLKELENKLAEIDRESSSTIQTLEGELAAFQQNTARQLQEKTSQIERKKSNTASARNAADAAAKAEITAQLQRFVDEEKEKTEENQKALAKIQSDTQALYNAAELKARNADRLSSEAAELAAKAAVMNGNKGRLTKALGENNAPAGSSSSSSSSNSGPSTPRLSVNTSAASSASSASASSSTPVGSPRSTKQLRAANSPLLTLQPKSQGFGSNVIEPAASASSQSNSNKPRLQNVAVVKPGIRLGINKLPTQPSIFKKNKPNSE